MAEIDRYLYKMKELNASDLHVSSDCPPYLRIHGKIKPLDEPVKGTEEVKKLLSEIVPQANKEEFAQKHDTDFAYELRGVGRFRVNIFMDRKGIGGL